MSVRAVREVALFTTALHKIVWALALMYHTVVSVVDKYRVRKARRKAFHA